MPNGTVYLLEPFTRQQNLSTYDLSHRDYYKGVIKTNRTFLGNVITSASSGRNQVQLAVLVFSLGDSNQTASLIGVLSSGLNFKTFNEILRSINLSNHENNTTISIPFNDSILNSIITNKSSNVSTTMPEQVPPQSVNGSKVGKI